MDNLATAIYAPANQQCDFSSKSVLSYVTHSTLSFMKRYEGHIINAPEKSNLRYTLFANSKFDGASYLLWISLMWVVCQWKATIFRFCKRTAVATWFLYCKLLWLNTAMTASNIVLSWFYLTVCRSSQNTRGEVNRVASTKRGQTMCYCKSRGH